MKRDRIVGYAAALWGAFGLMMFLWRLPGLARFVNALSAGNVVNGTRWGILLVTVWALLDIILIVLAWGVFRRSAPARTRLVTLLAILLGWSVVSAALGDGIPQVVALLVNPRFLKDVFLVLLLLSPLGLSTVVPVSNADWVSHEIRMDRAKLIGESWTRVGNWDNTILIPVVFGTILLAPFTYLAMGLYMLTVVLPLRPRLWGGSSGY